MSRKPLLVLGVLAAACASIAVHAQPQRDAQAAPSRHDIIEAVSPDVPTGAKRAKLEQQAFAARAKTETRAAAAPTVADVGDPDSFGRHVKWLGLTSAFVNLSDTCPVDPSNPDELCKVLNPAPALTAFTFEDTAHIILPGKATHSLLCYWFSPVLVVNYRNPGSTHVLARLRYSPTLTVENSLLSDPSLIDPTTGVPFGGKLLTSMTSSETLVRPLDAGDNYIERTRTSTVCMAGLLSKRNLMESYGLTDAQATEFFKRPTTVRLNVSGSAQYVGSATLSFGLRIVGD